MIDMLFRTYLSKKLMTSNLERSKKASAQKATWKHNHPGLKRHHLSHLWLGMAMADETNTHELKNAESASSSERVRYTTTRTPTGGTASSIEERVAPLVRFVES